MKNLINILICTILLGAACSCEKANPSPHTTQIEEGIYECLFYIHPVLENLGNGFITDKLSLEFYSLETGTQRFEPYKYNGELKINDEHMIKFKYGKEWGETLPHGEYLLRIVLKHNGKYLMREFNASANSSGLNITAYVEDYYSKLKPMYSNDTTKGCPGSKDNPYVISSYNDFRSMCSALRKDGLSGYSKHFIQTNSIGIPGTSGSLAEDGWFGTNFAGTYSGATDSIAIGGFSFAGSDMGNENYDIGLFRVLKNGASFNNIIFFTGGLNGVNHNCGILAGRIEEGATVKIKNCKFRGAISNSQLHTGGIIGYMSDGILIVDNCDIGVQISNCGDYTGGVAGMIEGNCCVDINRLTSKDNPIIVKGTKYVGGLFGRLASNEVVINNVSIAHESTQSENEVVVASDSYAGGLAGELHSSDRCMTFTIANTTLSFPVKGKNYVGGLTGKLANVGYALGMDNVKISSNVIGSKYVGGFIGATDSMFSSKPVKLELYNNIGFGTINSNVTKVTGETYVGGMIGYANNLDINTWYASSIKIMTSVEASGNIVGGVVGALYNNYYSPLSLKYFQFSPQAKITGKLYVGGVCGYMKNAAIDGGRYTFHFNENRSIDKIMTQSEFENTYIDNTFSGHKANVTMDIAGEEYIGGIAGAAYGDNCITDVYVISNVTGTEHVGGGVGYFNPDHKTISSVSAYNSNDKSVGYYFDRAGSDPYKSSYIRGIIVGASTKGIIGHDVLCGGIVGRLSGSGMIAHCINYATVTNGNRHKNKGGASGHGGIAGSIGSNNPGAPLLYYCVNTGNITADAIVGGITGRIVGGASELYLNIQYCANFGLITCNEKPNFPDAESACGGIFGDCSHPGILVVGCANHGNINANVAVHGLGGIAGVLGEDPSDALDGDEEHNGVIIGCANTGDIDNTSTTGDFGGIVGWMEEGYKDKGDAGVLGCYNKGRVIPQGGGGRGGIVGYVDRHAEIRYCISFTAPDYNDGECNFIWGNEKGAYSIANNYMMTDMKRDYAAPFNSANMSSKETFPKLNLDSQNSYWKMEDGDPHPQIRYCPFQNATYTRP